MTAACLLVRSPACSARQLQTSIVQVVHLCPTGFRKEPCERLERHKPKGLRVVLRGLGSSNAPRLPGGGGGDVTSLPDTWVGNHPGLPGPDFPPCRVGKGRPAGSIELRVSPSPSKIPYGGFSPVRLQMDRQWRPSTTSRGLSAVHIRPMTPSYTPPQFSLPGIRDPRRDYPF